MHRAWTTYGRAGVTACPALKMLVDIARAERQVELEWYLVEAGALRRAAM